MITGLENTQIVAQDLIHRPIGPVRGLRLTGAEYLRRCEIKRKCKRAFRSALLTGRLVKPKQCERCHGEPQTTRLHGHHRDYQMPLDVVWLCADCHLAEHRE